MEAASGPRHRHLGQPPRAGPPDPRSPARSALSSVGIDGIRACCGWGVGAHRAAARAFPAESDPAQTRSGTCADCVRTVRRCDRPGVGGSTRRTQRRGPYASSAQLQGTSHDRRSTPRPPAVRPGSPSQILLGAPPPRSALLTAGSPSTAIMRSSHDSCLSGERPRDVNRGTIGRLGITPRSSGRRSGRSHGSRPA
jgi:hypothetical protein